LSFPSARASSNETASLAGLKIPFRFDRERLQRDLERVAPGEWSDHYNERDFGGQWQGAALRSASGSVLDIGAGPAGNGHFADTPLLARCSYFREVLGEFLCPLKSVRLLSLAPGSFIREHSDHALGFEDGEVRIHIPIHTNPGVEFYVCGERLLLEEGECYYINVNLPHRVNNRGSEARIHLVIDAEVNDWVRRMFEACGDDRGKIPRSPLPPGGFEEFADVVFSDAVLRDKLRAIPDRADLVRSIAREAAARGFDLTEADIEAAYRAESSAASHGTGGWVPINVHFRESGPCAKWIYAPDVSFTEPYFEDTVRTCLQNRFTALFQREMPLTVGSRIRPDGFIFHMSRCGSTLVSRSLAAAESTLVIAEAPPLDQIVRANGPNRAVWLEWMVSALGGRRTEARTRYLIKLDAWHIGNLPLFREVFPGVPWVFLYRDPREVLVSLLNQPGLHACPGLMDPAIFGLREEDRTLSRQPWCIRVLESFLTAALAFREDPKGLFVDYKELPEAICGRIAKHFGLNLTAGDEARVEVAAQLDAKNPWAPFTGDTELKQLQARSLEADPVLSNLESLYLRLSKPLVPID
jgi:Aspartyl/Asparaginyl beta-hydroxylase